MTKSQQFPVSTAHNPIRISSKSNQKSEGENDEIPRERERAREFCNNNHNHTEKYHIAVYMYIYYIDKITNLVWKNSRSMTTGDIVLSASELAA